MTAPTLHGDFLTRPLAHRALHDRRAGRPENSRAAVRAAVEAGYGIEIDVQLSADGMAMVFHDYELSRLTGRRGRVRRFDADTLAAITLKGCDEGIPRLDEVLDLVAGQVPLLIELKDPSRRTGASDGALEADVARALVGYGGPVAVMSFNPEMVAELARCAPRVPRGLTTCAWRLRDSPRLSPRRRAHLRNIADFDRVGAGFISHDWRDLKRARVAELKARGVPVLCWTIRKPAYEVRARCVADNITFEGYLPAIG
jgi:glycerophosphoryl diester phosphodiesterase